VFVECPQKFVINFKLKPAYTTGLALDYAESRHVGKSRAKPVMDAIFLKS